MENSGMPFRKDGWSLQTMPAGYLMLEHRVIEDMVDVISGMLEVIEKKGKVNPAFIDNVADFIKTYADKSHHGKEEDIMFRKLSRKKLIPAHRKIMNVLIEEHKKGRKTVGKLIEAGNKYADGNTSALKDIIKRLKWLVDFYRKHIRKEDRGFFIPCMRYLSRYEQDKMFLEFCKYDDRKFLEKYEEMPGQLRKRIKR